MAKTFEPIATSTLGSAASSITFSSIPNTYTDLRLVLAVSGTSTVGNLYLRYNSDTGSNYSYTYIYGEGTSVASGRSTSATLIRANIFDLSSTVFFYAFDIFSYAGSTNKTVLISTNEDKNGSGSVAGTVGLWRNTNAINTIGLSASSNSFAAGTTATLYGILKA